MKRLLLFLTITLFFSQSSFAQWTPLEITTEQLYDVFFINETTGWIAGTNTILKTTDGGNNWISQTPATNIRYYSVNFEDELTGWAVGRTTSGTNGRVFSTTDGGDTWVGIPTGGSLPWWSVDFANDNQGVIVGQEGQIKYTPDGGTTWYDRTSPSGDAGIIKDVTFYDSLNGIAVGYSSPGTGFIMKTTDGGNSWANIDTNVTGGLESVSFLDGSEGLVVGSGGVIYRTVDGGDTWTARESTTTENLTGVHYYNESNAIAVGGVTVLYSNAFGLDWESQESNADYLLRSVFKNSANTAYAVGALGEVIKYCDICDGPLNVSNYDLDIISPELDIVNLSIAADGSSSTVFEYLGEDMENVSLSFEEELTPDPDFYGSFEDGLIDGETLYIVYNHPKYFSEPTGDFLNPQYKELTLQVKNNLTDELLYEYPIKIVRPSVLMVHGIWSNGEAAFGEMEDYLIEQAGMYNSNQIKKVNYTSDQYNFISLTESYIPQKNTLKRNARINNISLGKIDVLCHSNGGILTRQYIQSPTFRSDINKLITFNTPHSGSQLPNLLLDPSYNWLHPILEILGNNPNNGVISDLRVDGSFISNLNNPQNMVGRYSEIGLHTVTSTETVDNLVGSWDGFLVNSLGFHAEEAADIFLENTVFNTPNHDLIVPLPSQIAGCAATTPLPNQQHSGSTSTLPFIDKAIELLNQNPNNPSYFSLNGYNPPLLVSNFNNAEGRYEFESAETITITSPVAGTEFNSGQDVTINVIGSIGIENIVSTMGSTLIPFQNHVVENATSDNFNFTIPNDAIGRLEIVSSGFDANGYADFDSTYINVVTTATLDSLTVDQGLIYVHEGHDTAITVFGHYNDDQIRNITNITDLVYAFDNDNAEVPESGLVLGLTEGEDVLTISYLGKDVTVPVTIANAGEWVELPLTLESKIFLQGPYDTNTGLMKDDLRVLGFIPITSPYADAITTEATVFNLGGTSGVGLPEDDIVDWVWVELRDDSDNTIIIEGQSALLQRDGDIVDVDGVSLLKIEATADEYYLMIGHRNHLGILSANTLNFASGYSKINPSIDSALVTGEINAVKDMGDGNFALYAGDVNGDGQIGYLGTVNDSDFIKSTVLGDSGNTTNSNYYSFMGYNNADIDMNGHIRYLGPDNDTNILKDTILSYPDNTSGSNFFSFNSQVPN